MIKGDVLICGTTDTGTTSPIHLKATPGPPGGVDFDVFARATGVGFGNNAAVLVSYTIIEYTDNTFVTAKSHEKGIGTLTLGGSAGIANCTLARTTLQTTATSLNSQPATQNIAPGTGISIGTAANVLVFIGVSAADTLAFEPYFLTGAVSGSQTMSLPVVHAADSFATASATLTTGLLEYALFWWAVPMLVKRAYTYVGTAYSGGTPISNHYLGIYAIGTDSRPGKLLYDFGGCGSNCLNATGWISASQGNGFWLTPGEYFFVHKPVFSGGSAGPSLVVASNGGGGVSPWITSGRFNLLSNRSVGNGCAAFTDTSTTMADPAFLTNFTMRTSYNQKYVFGLASS